MASENSISGLSLLGYPGLVELDPVYCMPADIIAKMGLKKGCKVGSVSFNPRYPSLLSTSGSRHFLNADIRESNEGDEEDEDEVKRNRPIMLVNSVESRSGET
jgi:hypothetical protein